MPTTEPMTPTDLGRAWRELPGWRWMRGMLALAADGRAFRIRDHGGRPEPMLERGPRLWCPAPPLAEMVPDTSDHATVGCLHALAEEMCGGPVELLWDGSAHHARTFTEVARAQCKVGIADGPTKAHALYALVMEVSRG